MNPSTGPSGVERFTSLRDHARAQENYEMEKNQIVEKREVNTEKMCKENVKIWDERWTQTDPK